VFQISLLPLPHFLFLRFLYLHLFPLHLLLLFFPSFLISPHSPLPSKPLLYLYLLCSFFLSFPPPLANPGLRFYSIFPSFPSPSPLISFLAFSSSSLCDSSSFHRPCFLLDISYPSYSLSSASYSSFLLPISIPSSSFCHSPIPFFSSSSPIP
jgi:hypothetical protein